MWIGAISGRPLYRGVRYREVSLWRSPFVPIERMLIQHPETLGDTGTYCNQHINHSLKRLLSQLSDTLYNGLQNQFLVMWSTILQNKIFLSGYLFQSCVSVSQGSLKTLTCQCTLP